MMSSGDATWTLHKFPAAVWTAIVHLISTVDTKGALKTADESFPAISQARRALLAYIAHL